MAKLFVNEQTVEIEDGEKIVNEIEEMGVPIGCSNGVCGTCELQVLEGMENLSEKNAEENDLGMEGNRRLGCQVTINGGVVRCTY